MKKLICFIAVMMLTVITASAQELNAHITADEQTGAIMVSGTGAAYGGQLVSILIARDEGGFYSPDSPLITEAVHSDENGDFSVNIILSEPFMGGEYQAEIATADSNFSTSFVVVSLDYAQDLFEFAKKCKTKAELKEILQTRPYDMGVSPSYWEFYSSALTDAVYFGIGDCKTVFDFIKLCRSSLAMERILSGEDIAGVLKESENSMYIGDVTCYDMWNSLDDEGKARVMDNYTYGNDPALCFAESCLMSAVESAESWRELSDVIYPSDENVFAGVLDLNTEYFTSKNSDQIMRLIYKEINSMDTPEDIRKIFFKVSKNYENKKEGSSGGSSGGSIGSASPVVQAPASVGEIVFDYKSDSDDIGFTDINGHWGENYITKLSKSGDVNGYADGSFRPDNLVTRAEFVTMLYNCFDIIAYGDVNSFSDVESSQWYAESVIACKSLGIVYGDEFNCFNPDQYITREDAAVMMHRILCRMAEFETVSQIPFNDEATISDYAKNAVGTLVDEGVISGFGNGYFRPLENTTRAQAVTMLVKSMDLLNAVS